MTKKEKGQINTENSINNSIKTMNEEDKTTENMERCSHFNSCSQNFCPLDLELALRVGKEQDKCRWMREPRKTKIQNKEFVSGGSVLPNAILNFVPEGNVGRLNESSQARWHELLEKDKKTL